MINYYHILGVSPNATAVEIKSAYKSKALSFHPDKHNGDKNMEELFKQVNEAYQILSNPYKRSNHDMMLRYGELPPSSPSPTYQQYNRPRRPPQARKFYRPQVSNFRATAYAFLIAFSIALIMKTAMYISNEYQAKERAELLAARRLLFDQVKAAHDQGNLGKSLHLLGDMGYFLAEEGEMQAYKESLIVEIKDKADQLFEAGAYEQAIAHYDLLKDFAVSNSITYLKKMAAAYQGMGEVGKALEVFQLMHLYGYRTTSFYLEMGQLYEDGIKDLEMALNYYKIGAEMASSEYEVTIGKAYPIVISASMVPAVHYHIYMKVAQAHLNLEQYQEAVDAVSWTKDIWPDSLIQFQVEALAYHGLGQKTEMKQAVARAKQIDPNFSIDR
ncbi:J domain-containing protein [Reichenbachiella carrageenanivorans]|uniref:J domain-containing protein n=1 Tax=Reichenbachiella carrageenanivorans TaxID=2979869 RepID=A0ABY6D5K4_9BACT|nr:J domain-containing protein [Reichenbachiella carrageenanivorans]UXX81189.1 J domain-containing protein [Reichenbachiella carrageenanivorans]